MHPWYTLTDGHPSLNRRAEPAYDQIISIIRQSDDFSKATEIVVNGLLRKFTQAGVPRYEVLRAVEDYYRSN